MLCYSKLHGERSMHDVERMTNRKIVRKVLHRYGYKGQKRIDEIFGAEKKERSVPVHIPEHWEEFKKFKSSIVKARRKGLEKLFIMISHMRDWITLSRSEDRGGPSRHSRTSPSSPSIPCSRSPQSRSRLSTSATSYRTSRGPRVELENRV